MDELAPPARTARWVIGIASLLWNGFGAYDYLMTRTHNPDYLARFTADQRAYFESFPSLIVAAWAIGVWCALLGSLLLVAGRRQAVTAFWASLAGLAASTAWQWGASAIPPSLQTPGMLAMNAVIWAIAIGLVVYSSVLRAAGRLR